MHLNRLLTAISAAICFSVFAADPGPVLLFDFSKTTPEGFSSENGAILCRTENAAPQSVPGVLEVNKKRNYFIEDSEQLHFKDTLTVSVWLYQPEFTGDYQALLFKGSRKGTPQIDFMLSLYDSFPEFKYLDERGLWRGILRRGETLTDGRISVPLKELHPLPVRKWTLLTAVFDKGRITLYVNGEKYFESSWKQAGFCPSRHPLKIGRGERIGGETAYHFRGLLDNLLICERPLSPAEIERLYESEKNIVERNEVKESVRNSGYDPFFRKKLPSVAQYEKTIPADLLKNTKVVCEVLKLNGIPRLFINGKVHDSTAMMPSPYVDHAEVFLSCRDFAAAGIHIYSDILWTTHPKKQWWQGEGKYDFSWVDERIRAIVKADPDALIFPRVKLDPPAWWSRENPDQMITDSDGTKVNMVSMASEKWTALYSRMLRDLIAHMESMDYAGHIIGYQPAGGQSSEWGCNTGGKSDYSPAAQEAFRKWVKARYENKSDKLKKAYGNPEIAFETVRIPSKKIRSASEHLFFREGPESRIVFDYREFLTDITVRNILNSCGIVKEATKRGKIAGIFYGCSTFSTDLQNTGFQGLRRVLNSNDVDFLCSPAAYSSRPVGQSAIYQSFYTASYRLHNKFFWEEADQRTHLYTKYISYRADNAFETTSMMHRSFGYSLTKNTGLWWFLIAGNATFHEPRIMKEVADMESLSRAALKRPVRLPGDVAVFVSEESFFHTNGGLFANELVNIAADVLTVSGISFDYYILPDIAHIDFPDYKVYLFLNAFRVDPEIRKAIDGKVKKDGKVAVWLYAPGYIGPDGLDLKGIESLTGIRILEKNVSGKVSFARLTEPSGKITSELASVPRSVYEVGPLFYADDPFVQVLSRTADNLSILVLKDMRTWKSIYSLLPLSPGLIRGICDFAGVHVYSRSNDILSVNDRYLMLHAASPGQKVLFLPAGVRARDLFSGKEFLPEKGVFKDDFKMGETKIYELLK